MLLSAGYELPKKIFAHGFFTVDGEKISKSLGNAIDPIALAEKYGVDALRYYLFKEIPFGNDGDFSHGRLEEVYNADLANGLGNLVARTAKLAEKLNLELNIDSNLNLKEKVSFALLFENLNFQKALEEIWHKYHNLDHYLEREKPWEIKDKNVLKRILSYTVSEIIKINQFLEPFLPKTAELINRQLLRKKITSTTPLFPRI